MGSDGGPEEVGARIEEVLRALRSQSGEVAEMAEELVSLLVRMYGDGLARILDRLDTEEIARLTEDRHVAALLVLHDLHPVRLDERIGAALDEVRPYLGSHAGGVEYLGVDDAGVAHLSLQGSCDGCPASSVTVKTAIEGAILKAAPEVVRVDVEGVVEQSPGTPVSLGPTRRAPNDSHRWIEVPSPPLRPGELREVDLAGSSIVMAQVNAQLYAYGPLCPGCGSALASAAVKEAVLTCRRCSSSFDLTAAGRGVDIDMMLDPIPLLTENGTVRVAVVEGVA